MCSCSLRVDFDNMHMEKGNASLVAAAAGTGISEDELGIKRPNGASVMLPVLV